MLFACVFVKAAPGFASEHLGLLHFLQDRRRAGAGTKRFFERGRDIDRDVDPDLVDQTQRPHRHPPFDERGIDLLRSDAVFEKLRGFEQIGKKDTVNEESGAVLYHHRELPDLPGKEERTFFRFVGSLFSDHDFDQFHPADRIEKMESDDAARMLGLRGEIADRKRGSVGREDVSVVDFRVEVVEDGSFDFDLLGGRLDHHLHLPHRAGIGGGDNTRAALLRFLLAHQAALDRFGIGLLDPGQAAIEQLAADVAQDHGHAARAEPLRDARAHHTRTDDGGVHHFFAGRLRRALLVFVGEEEIANQVAGRFRFAQLDDGVELAGERVFDRTRQAAVDDFGRATGRGILGARRFDWRCWTCGSTSLRRDSLPRVQFPARGFEQLVLRNDFVDQSELQGLRGRIKFSFENDFGGLLRTDQARQSCRSPPRRDEAKRRFRQTDPRRGRVRRDAVIAGQRDLITAAGAGAVDRRHGRDFERGEPVENSLTFRDEGAHLAGLRLSQQRLQIGARDEDRLLGRGHDHPFRAFSFSMKSRWSLRSRKAAASKMFAPESGRSKVNRQTLSLPISRRIKGAAGEEVIWFSLTGFAKNPSRMGNEDEALNG